MTDLKNTNDAIMCSNENDQQLHVIMYGNKNFDNNMNINILTATWFDQPFLTIIKTGSFIHARFNCFIKEVR